MTQANNVAIESSQINSSGILTVPGGGTGLASLTAGYIPYGNGTGVLSNSANLTFNGTTLSVAGESNSGNYTFTGTGNRITGDFSSTSPASNRVAFQTSTTNGITILSAIPNGTATQANFVLYNNVDFANSAQLNTLINASEASIRSGISGTGTYVPITMYTGGSERLRITTTGIVDIGGTSGGSVGELLVVEGANSAGHRAARINNTSTTNGYSTLWMGSSNDGLIRGGSTAGSFTDQLLLLTSGSIPISFYTANTERMRIDSSGNVGIGITSASHRLHVYDSTNATVMYANSGSTGVYLRLGNSVNQGGYLGYEGTGGTNMTFYTSATEKMRIDSSGNVGIGGSPAAKFDINNGALGRTLIQYNGTSFNYFDVDTHVWRNAAATERMRIHSSGGVSIGNTTDPGIGNLSVTGSVTSSGGNPYLYVNRTSSSSGQMGIQFQNAATTLWYNYVATSGTNMNWYSSSASVNVMALTTAGDLTLTGNCTATAFIASSDERLKTNWSSLDSDFVSRLADVKNGTFERISSGNREVGVTAQSLQTLIPEAVIEGGDGMLSVNYGGAALVAAIELAKEVKALRAEIAELKKGRV